MHKTWVPSLGWEDPLGEGNGNPLQYSCLENPMDRGAWWAIVHGFTKELDMTKQLNNNNNGMRWGMYYFLYKWLQFANISFVFMCNFLFFWCPNQMFVLEFYSNSQIWVRRYFLLYLFLYFEHVQVWVYF